MKLYHVTDEEKFKVIMQEGITPQLGTNSTLAKERAKLVFLCSKEDVGYWKVLLGKDVVLEVDVDIDDCSKCDYSYYSEYIYHWTIKPDKIRRVNIETERDQMRALCISHIRSLSYLCVSIVKYYVMCKGYDYDKRLCESLNQETDEKIAQDIVNCMGILERLDYSCLEKKEICDILEEDGESGEFTFCDNFFSTKLRLWQMLVILPEDSIAPKRRELYSWITENFDGCLETDTGGFTCNRALQH